MSAKEFGRKLLGEVEETSLHDILEQLRAINFVTQTSSSPNYFNFPPLDHILSFFQPPTSAAQSALPGQADTSPSTTLNSPRRLKSTYPPVVELTSVDTGSGKTHLLYQIIARSVINTPTHKANAVLVFDTDNRFSIGRLAEVVQAYIVSSSSSSTTTDSAALHTTDDDDREDIADALQRALAHVHIFRPQSLASLVSTLQSLPDYLLASPFQHYSSNRAVGLLVLDSASVFFWQERLAAELASLDEDGDIMAAAVPGAPHDGELGEESSSPSRNWPMRSSRNGNLNNELATALRSTQSLLGCAVIYTTHTLPSSTSSKPNPSDATTTIPMRTALPAPVSALPPSFPTLRLLCSRDAVKKFPVGMTLAQLKLDAPARMAVVAKAGWTANVVPGGRLDEGVRGRMGRSQKARGFAFGLGLGGESGEA